MSFSEADYPELAEPSSQIELTKRGAVRDFGPAKLAMAAALDRRDPRAIEDAEGRLEAIYSANPSLLDDQPKPTGYTSVVRDRYDPSLGGHDF